MTTICPQCGSDRVSERHIGRKTGGIVGGAAGALSGAGTGAAIGSVIACSGDGDWGGYWRSVGTVCRWSNSRSCYGAAMDGVLFDRYVCRDCEHTFD